MLSATESRDLAAVLDAIIPPSDDGRLPGAGALGLVPVIEEAMRGSAFLAGVVREGLAALAGFAGLADERRHEVLNELAASQPAFLPGLIFQTYLNYYLDDRVVAALGLEARPPHPQGYALEAGDLAPLERVRARGRLYREV